MATRVALNHKTRYVYDRPVDLSPQVIRLRPAPHCRTPIEAYSLRVTPAEHFLNWHQDPFGNWLARLVFEKPTTELVVEVDLVATLVTVNPFGFFLEEAAERWPVDYEADVRRDLAPYLEVPKTGRRFDDLVRAVLDRTARRDRRTVDVLVDLNQLLQRSVRYDIRMDPGVFTPEETLERGHGSCRDFAWLFVALLRRLGLAARFVSGYSIQLRPDQKPLEGPVGVLEDCTDLHAWAEAYLPGAGWVGLDATSGLFAGEGHLPLACTADPGAAAPISGSFAFAKKHEKDEVRERFSVEMGVARIDDRPRSTKPYTDEQWSAIVACGDAVNRALEAGDARLTMGGEPTFVSIDDIEGVEWSTAALGPGKEKLADDLLRRLRRRFAPGGLLHHGQGKWYPGEPLPRWAYSCYWRPDGDPVWRDPALLADANRNHGADEAAKVARALIQRLGVRAEHLMPAHEDAWYYLWRERNLPVNVDPFDAKLDDEIERERLRRVFSKGLASIAGYALPLRADTAPDGTTRWESGRWFLRDERLYLLPGDSPMGLRLPLDSLPWTTEADRVLDSERDPFAPRAALPSRDRLGERRPSMQRSGSDEAAPRRGASAKNLLRSALCVEPRAGMLHVFFPPIPLLEHYLDLVAAVEESAREVGMPVRIEGYPPPQDPRLCRLQVTPDPGVLEVNIHPSRTWPELVQTTSALYEEAREARLGTEKFMIDGRHSGTGGGNHVVIGGATPGDSPLLRRPDLLRSLVAYWLNHPSLSYLFSGLFLGPTSQAPRIDEARSDALYELDIAFRTVPEGASVPPWLADRLFRHLLVDVTGNTHRTELCIDKLYSPDSAAGRQGLLELRAFEMPPDAKMSSAQQLLVRALVAAFWQKPYDLPIVRWGTALHDRFALPHFVWQDFEDVAGDVARAGFPLAPEWMLPHWEFRFPRVGSIAAAGLELELRQAIEPWHVLGEEQSAGGTARYVDSSVERLQVLVRGMTESRHVVACNGREVPLHPTGRSGEFVAGVRFKAWKPPSALHPTLDVDSPLVFDVYDTWSGRAVGGCTHHVSHPGGQSYDLYPKNALEAESRRAGRFWPFGHTPGPAPIAPRASTLEMPMTLDLRR